MFKTYYDWVRNNLFEFLKNGYYNGLFKNTAIFLYSDHGQRFVDKRSDKEQRYLDERLPFFAVYLPKSYRIRNQAKYNNLRINSVPSAPPRVNINIIRNK